MYQHLLILYTKEGVQCRVVVWFKLCNCKVRGLEL